MQKEQGKMHPKTLEEQFGQAPMLPLIMKMALPAVAAQMVNLLYNIVDRIYIGHLASGGTEALAGVGICSTVIILISAFAQIVGSGAAPLASIALGAGNHKKASRLMNNGFALLLLFGLILVIPAYLFMEPILGTIGASTVTMPFAKAYLRVYLLGTFFVLISLGMTPFLNVLGKPRKSMLAVLIGAVLNIILDPLLMFVLKMGVAGAALATVISQCVSAMFVLGFLVSGKGVLQLNWKDMQLSGRLTREMFSLGIAPFVMSSTESLIGFVLNRSLAGYGDIYVSTLTVMQSGMQLVNVPLQGFAQGSIAVCGFNYGAKNRKRLVEGFKIVMTTMFSVNAVIVLWMLLAPRTVAAFFTSNEALIASVEYAMPLFLTGMLIFGAQRACQNMFIAMNQPKISLFIALLRKVILLVPLALILPHVHHLGVDGVFLAESIADGTAAILCVIIFSIRFPQILRGMRER